MEQKSFFSKLKNWLQTSEMFIRPSKLVPGKWQLFEYYIEPEDELVNIKEGELNSRNEHLKIEFGDNNEFFNSSNLSTPVFSEIKKGEWSISKNFLSLIHPSNFRNNIKFQFAIEKGNLKLLKKDALGKIEFFGFFKRLD